VRWPLSPNAIIVAPPPAATALLGWCHAAYAHGAVVTAMTLAHHHDAELSEKMRPVLLDHARQLVEVLKGEVAATAIKH
jgi:hypothetical protein